MPEATYKIAYQLATTPDFQNQVLIALYVGLENSVATSQDPVTVGISTQYLGQDLTGMSERVALRISDQMPGLTPNDTTVQTAVNALIPPTGAYSL